ncbi:MAG: hypothetical protein KC457_00890 [Myxococcales bacterium]|nr:hypothetical protein [Myxococcales bacterium]
MTAKVERKGPGLAALRRTLGGLQGAGVRWGVFQDAGEHDKADMPMTTLMAIHELGARLPNGTQIPARSPMRMGTRAARREITDLAKQGLALAVTALSVEPEKALLPAGRAAAEAIKRTIRSGQLTPLSPATLANKDRDPAGIPLDDTGQLLEAIRAELG